MSTCKTIHSVALTGAIFLFGQPLCAQGLSRSYVNNSTGTDSVWLCQDLDSNGDYNGVGELTIFYDDLLGSIDLGSPSGSALRPDGSLLVSDGLEDIILLLADLNNNGDALDAGEATVFFDGDPTINASGITMASARHMWVDDDFVVWVAVASTSGNKDIILRLEDLNADGSANGPGESSIFFDIMPGAGTGDTIPSVVLRGQDGALYYVETGTVKPRGVYRLEDLDGSGAIDQPGEETTYFVAPFPYANPFHWSASLAPDGRMLLVDGTSDAMWFLDDINGDGVIDNTTAEATIFWEPVVLSRVWGIDFADDGSVYVGEDQTPDRLLRLHDANGDGTIDLATEVATIYDETVSLTDIGSPRSVVVIPEYGSFGTAYCQPITPNSSGQLSQMDAVGSPFAANNAVTLTASQLPLGQFGYFLNSDAPGSFSGLPNTRGILCLGGNLGRYNDSSEIFFSGAGGVGSLILDLTDTPTNLGPVAILAGQTWYFQCWHRDSMIMTSNFSNGLEIQFQ